uniref:CSON007851 protein n=1 Tax=Culicoides sonorensis TaxID=179676 RepID=A0A336LY10_CULSO
MENNIYKCFCADCTSIEKELIVYSHSSINPGNKHFLRDEVVLHNKPNDFWIILHENALKFLLLYGGKDISHYFHRNITPKTRISAQGNTIPVFPPVIEKSGSDFFGDTQLCWWQDPAYVIGRITKKPREIRIINTLTATTQKMTVCEEDTLREIQKKYNHYNWNQESYEWFKYDPDRNIYSNVCLDKTLTANGFICNEFQKPYTPSLWLFFKDDVKKWFNES